MPDRSCFVIAPIGEEGSDIRAHSDQVLKYIIQPSVLDKGFSAPIRADQIESSGLITTQIVDRVVGSDLVVADLTNHNPNVFYELSVRHATRKPFIQLIKKGEQIPFDTVANRTIFFDLKDLDSVEAAKKSICLQIESFDSSDADSDSPISIAIDLKGLRESGKPEALPLVEIIEGISDLRGYMSRIEQGFESTTRRAVFEMAAMIDQRLSSSNRDRSSALGPEDLVRVDMMLSRALSLLSSIGKREASGIEPLLYEALSILQSARGRANMSAVHEKEDIDRLMRADIGRRGKPRED